MSRLGCPARVHRRTRQPGLPQDGGWARAAIEGWFVRGSIPDSFPPWTAAELSKRLNPRHPRWYDDYLARILFLLGRYEEAADILRQKTSAEPGDHPRDMGWRTAACGHLGQGEEARRCAGWFVGAVGKYWRGDPAAGPREYINWFVDVSCLKQTEDEERLREGLLMAGLPG